VKTLRVSKDEIKEYEKLKIITQITSIRERIRLFETKYGCKFEKFERDVKTRQEEDFDIWDNYIEWRAYLKSLGELEGRIKEIENAHDITIT